MAECYDQFPEHVRQLYLQARTCLEIWNPCLKIR